MDEKPGIAAVSCTSRGNVSFARKDFLELFSEEVKEYLTLGSVYTAGGKKLEKFATFMGKERLLIRGDPAPKPPIQKSGEKPVFFLTCCNPCSLCGHPRYIPFYPYYLLKEYLTGQPVYESGGTKSLVINEELCQRIDRKKWKGIYITKLPVIDKPKDEIDLNQKELLALK